MTVLSEYMILDTKLTMDAITSAFYYYDLAGSDAAARHTYARLFRIRFCEEPTWTYDFSPGAIPILPRVPFA